MATRPGASGSPRVRAQIELIQHLPTPRPTSNSGRAAPDADHLPDCLDRRTAHDPSCRSRVSASAKLFLVGLGRFGFTRPRIIRRISPSSPASWHVSKSTDTWIALVCATETDDESVFHVCGCATKDLPVRTATHWRRLRLTQLRPAHRCQLHNSSPRIRSDRSSPCRTIWIGSRSAGRGSTSDHLGRRIAHGPKSGHQRLNYAARTLRLKRSTSLARVGMNELLDGMLIMLLASGEECVNVLFRVQVTLTKQREHLDATFFDALD